MAHTDLSTRENPSRPDRIVIAPAARGIARMKVLLVGSLIVSGIDALIRCAARS
jgi:hypothetical protein